MFDSMILFLGFRPTFPEMLSRNLERPLLRLGSYDVLFKRISMKVNKKVPVDFAIED
jgi:hypothetical protein